MRTGLRRAGHPPSLAPVPGIITIRDSGGILLSNLNRQPQRGEMAGSWVADDGRRIPDTHPLVLYKTP